MQLSDFEPTPGYLFAEPSELTDEINGVGTNATASDVYTIIKTNKRDAKYANKQVIAQRHVGRVIRVGADRVFVLNVEDVLAVEN